jgi:hypothetical protein
MAAEARRQGWRIVAFAFDGVPVELPHAARVVASQITELGPVVAELEREGASAILLSGRFRHAAVVAGRPDATVAAIAERAGSLVDRRLLEAVVAMLADRGIAVLDQRPFLGDWLAPAGAWSARAPSDAEWRDIRAGLALARTIAQAQIGQAVVVKQGAVVAVEAVEGTTEAIRRGTALGGPGTVVVKAVAADHDYRLDTPTIGLETLGAAAAGGVAAIAVEAGRVLIIDREAVTRRADAAGIALVSVADVGA